MKMNQVISGWQSGVEQLWAGETSSARKNKRRVKKIWRVLFPVGRAIFLFSLCLVLLYPLLIMISIAFRNPSELYDPTVVWIPKHFTLSSFRLVFEKLDLTAALWQTVIITIIGTLCQLISCMLAGYGFARFRFPCKKLLFGVLLLMIIVPPQVVTIPSMMDFQRFDFFGIGQIAGLFTGTPLTVSLRDTLWAYFLPALLGNGIKSGLFIFIFIQFFRGLPDELQDAAYIDGCGRLRTFAVIMMPLAGAAILTVTLFSIVWYWNDSYFSVIHFDNLQTVSSFLQGIKSAISDTSSGIREIERIPVTQASAVVAIAPLLVMYILLQRYFTESIERTGIVG